MAVPPCDVPRVAMDVARFLLGRPQSRAPVEFCKGKMISSRTKILVRGVNGAFQGSRYSVVLVRCVLGVKQATDVMKFLYLCVHVSIAILFTCDCATFSRVCACVLTDCRCSSVIFLGVFKKVTFFLG